MARPPMRGIGHIEFTLRSDPDRGRLFLEGQTVSRAEYPALWQWVQAHGLVAGHFTAGDGETTFGLPDLRMRWGTTPVRWEIVADVDPAVQVLAPQVLAAAERIVRKAARRYGDG